MSTSDGALVPLSTVALVLKNGTQITSECIDEPKRVEEDYTSRVKNDSLSPGPFMKVITGNPDGLIMIVDVREVALFTVRKHVDEKKVAAEFNQRSTGQPKRPSLIVPMR